MTDATREPRYSHVLVVDDDEAQLRSVMDILRAEGFGVGGCSTGARALKHLRNERIGVALVDLRLPDLDGIEVLERLRAVSDHVQVIIHTGHASYTSAKDAVNLGAFAYVEKGGHPSKLVDTVRRAFAARLKRYAVELEDAATERTRELQEANEALRVTEVNLSRAQRIAHIGSWSWDVRTGVVAVSDETYRVFGFVPGEVEPSCDVAKSTTHPDDTDSWANALAAAMESGDSLQLEYRAIRTDGKTIWIRTEAEIARGEDGEALSFFGTAQDITERKRVEEQLRASENKFRKMFDESPFGIELLDSDGTVVEMNKKLIEIFGLLDPEQLIGKWSLLEDPNAPEEVKAKMRQGEHIYYESTFDFDIPRERKSFDTAKSGTIAIGYSIAPLFDPVNNSIQNYLVQVADITDRKRAEEAVRESEKKHRILFESSRDAIMTLAPPSWGFTSGNPACISLFGAKDEAEFTLFPLWDLSPKHQPDGQPSADKAMEMIDTAMREGAHFFEWTHKRLDETEFPADVLLTRTELAGQALLQATVRDRTEQKKAEQELHTSKRHLEETLHELKQAQRQVIQQERLRALGQMASGVAHDLNNTLSPILGYAELAASSPDLPDKVRGWLEWIQTGARDAATVVTRLRQFYHPEDVGSKTTVDLGGLLEQIPELTHPKWRDEAQRTGRTIEMDLALEDGVCVLGNASELREVFMNLVFNAVDAMPNGGKITLGLYVIAEFAFVEVTDTGIGMSDEVAHRCFEPFFSAEKDEGTGLGLSVCHGVTTRHGGRIEIDSTPGCGTTVRVCLPLARESASPAPEPRQDALPTRRVLYIDDDNRLRQLARALFERLGQKADLAESGAEGLDRFRSNDYDVVVTDLGMPGINGYEVTRIMKSSKPHIPVIMVTGWGSGRPAENSEQAPFPDEIVAKPLTATKLSRAIRKVFA